MFKAKITTVIGLNTNEREKKVFYKGFCAFIATNPASIYLTELSRKTKSILKFVVSLSHDEFWHTHIKIF